MAQLVADYVLNRLTEWGVHRIYGYPGDGINAFLRAIRIALDQKTVCTLVFPGDVQEERAVPSPPRVHGAVYSSVGYARPRIVPQETELDRAAELLNGAEKVAMLVGQGALGASEEV